MLDLNAQLVAERHLCHGFSQTMAFHRIRGNDSARSNLMIKLLIPIHELLINRQIILISLYMEHNNLTACLLKLRSDDVLLIGNIHGKGYQCRRNVNLIEGSGHAVLSTDGWKSESHLCCISTEKCCERLAPSLRIFCHTTEVFLECETDLLIVTTCSHDSGNGLCHCIGSSVVWAPGG